MLDFISNNREWIFSGVGVTAILIVGGYLIKLFKKEKDRTANLFVVDVPKAHPLVSVYSMIPNPILRLRFPESRFNSLLRMDVRPRGESVRLNLGELPCTGPGSGLA